MSVIKPCLRSGWKIVHSQFYVILILIIIQLLWGYFLFRFVDQTIFTILRRYPDTTQFRMATETFWFEGQLLLQQVSKIKQPLIILSVLLGIRMILAPLINAGIIYALHHRNKPPISFFHGIKTSWKTATLGYIIEIFMKCFPGYWIISFALSTYNDAQNYTEASIKVIPMLLGWLFYAMLIRHAIYYILFGKIGGLPTTLTFSTLLRCSFPLIAIASTILIVTCIINCILLSCSLIWAGMIALILQQVSHIIRTIIKFWSINSHYELWQYKLNR